MTNNDNSSKGLQYFFKLIIFIISNFIIKVNSKSTKISYDNINII